MPITVSCWLAFLLTRSRASDPEPHGVAIATAAA